MASRKRPKTESGESGNPTPAGKRPKTESGYVIGIDLGTTFSCVAVAINGRIEIIANDQGNRTTPSSVAFDSDDRRFIGEAATNQAAVNPRRTIFDVKRLIGKMYDDVDVQNDMKRFPYRVVNRDGKPYVDLKSEGVNVKTEPVNVNNKTSFSPEEISAMVLAKMKETAESYLGEPVAGAVVTVPAYFNDAQRQATRDAGTIAGLNVRRIINEPTAGALAYGLDRKKKMSNRKRKILVYDLGGGTFDVSVVSMKGDVFEVLATGGDTHLGGGDFDQRVMRYFVDLIKKKYGKDISDDGRALGKLRKECERAKRGLSNQSQVRVEIEYLLGEGKDFSELLTRAKFEELNMDLFKKTMEIVKQTMGEGKVKKKEIREIVLVGGSTRIPKVREMLKEMFDGKELCQTVNPDEAVAYGAAVLGAKLGAQTCSSGALGCGITLLEVTPLSLGIQVTGGIMNVVIPKNTRIPTNMSRSYSTSTHQQTTIGIKVFQGERPLTKDCVKLGSFALNGIPPAPRGVGTCLGTFDIDEDGILTVTAKNTTKKMEGNSESLTITSYKGNLSKEEVERMVREAKEMAAKDKTEKERIEARNRLEGYISDVKAELNDREGDKAEMESALEEASRWLKDNMNNASKQDYEDKEAKLTVKWTDVRQKLRVVIQVD